MLRTLISATRRRTTVGAVAGALLITLTAACGGGTGEPSVVGTSGSAAAMSVGDALKAADAGGVEVTGRVTRLAGARTFWIGGGGAEALVVLPAGGKGVTASGVRPGANVVVRGTLHRQRADD